MSERPATCHPDRSAHGRGLCHPCYERLRRLSFIPKPAKSTDADYERRFWGKVLIGDGCWEWTAAKRSGGYGVFMWPRLHPHAAHRLAYELLVGPIPNGLTLDHLCRNPGCVRPDHLEPVTIGVNVLRGLSASGVNLRKTHCVNGHLFDDHNTRLRREPGTQPWRVCRECDRIRQLRYQAARRASAA